MQSQLALGDLEFLGVWVGFWTLSSFCFRDKTLYPGIKPLRIFPEVCWRPDTPCCRISTRWCTRPTRRAAQWCGLFSMSKCQAGILVYWAIYLSCQVEVDPNIFHIEATSQLLYECSWQSIFIAPLNTVSYIILVLDIMHLLNSGKETTESTTSFFCGPTKISLFCVGVLLCAPWQEHVCIT